MRAFAYHCAEPVRARALIDETMIKPHILVGRDPAEMDAILAELRHKLHILWGRYGISIFAISAADIALHDLAAKAAGVSLAEHLGPAPPCRPARLCQPDPLRQCRDGPVRRRVRRGIEGYGMIKLHEIELEPVLAVAPKPSGPTCR